MNKATPAEFNTHSFLLRSEHSEISFQTKIEIELSLWRDILQ